MNLQYIKDVVPQISDEQILGVATALARQPEGDRQLFARMLGLDGERVMLNNAGNPNGVRDRNSAHRRAVRSRYKGD